MRDSTFKERLQRAKDVDIVSYLRSVGLKPKTVTGVSAMYFSPFNEETNPSFSVSMTKNLWKDFSADKGGDVIDLVQELQKCDFKTAINILTGERSRGIKLERQSHDHPREVREGIKVEKVSHISDIELIEYAVGRKIDIDVLSKYYKEVHIRFPYSKTNPDRLHVCLGFENDSGAYELRNKYLRVASSPKDVTTIKGKGNEMYLFESNWDFLALLSYLGIMSLPGTVYVLNGAGLIGGLAPFLKDKSLFYWGHSDSAGDKVLDVLLDNNVKAVDCRNAYKGFDDFNDYVMAKL
jgi:hypothetical protein